MKTPTKGSKSPGGFHFHKAGAIIIAMVTAVILLFASTGNTMAQGCCATQGTNFVGSGGSFPAATCQNFTTQAGWTWVGCNTLPYGPMKCTEADNAGSFLGNWTGVDHTTGGAGNGSYFLLFDGPGGGGNSVVWSQGVSSLTPGVVYVFSAWVRSVCTTCYQANITSADLQVNGVTIASSGAVATTAGWVQVCGTWTAPAGTTTATLGILLEDGQNSGNDGGIDDISFMAAANPNSDFTYPTTACNNPITFTPADPSGTHTWDFGDGTVATNPHQFPAPGFYIVTHTVTSTCGTTSTTQKIIQIESCCTCTGDLATSLITDGSFTNPCLPLPPYGSDYTRQPCGAITTPGTYSETPSVAGWAGRTYCNPTDHTPGGGTNYLVFDGIVGTGEARAWFQTGPNNNGKGWLIPPTHQPTYCFKASFLNPEYAFPAKPSVRLVVKACGVSYTVATLNFLPYNDHCGWTTICGCWTPPTNCFHIDELDIMMTSNDCSAANDIVIDDIIFSETQTECSQTCGAGTQHDNNGYQLNPNKNTPFDHINNIDGKEGDVINMQDNKNNGLVDVHPVPVNKGTDLHVSYTAAKDENITLQILDNSGAPLMTTNPRVKTGSNDIIVKTNSLPPGSYVLRATGEYGSQSKMVIVQ